MTTEMTPEQEAKLDRLLSGRGSEPELPAWQTRLALVLVVLDTNADDFMAIYTRGGGHPKDLDKARLCESLAVLIAGLFPELAE